MSSYLRPFLATKSANLSAASFTSGSMGGSAAAAAGVWVVMQAAEEPCEHGASEIEHAGGVCWNSSTRLEQQSRGAQPVFVPERGRREA